MAGTRFEQDSLGQVEVPGNALYGAQTQRAVNNFGIGGEPLDHRLIIEIARIKACAAGANAELGLLSDERARAIEEAARQIVEGHHVDQFPVDLYQTGSGTSSNMNVNEVVAHLASATCAAAVHPNDHVNLCQSSNDVIPAAIQLAAARALQQQLLPAVERLAAALQDKARTLADVVKTGRTHLMDAMPLRLEQELDGWCQQIRNAGERLRAGTAQLYEMPLGATAIGTGINAHPDYAQCVTARLAVDIGLPLTVARNFFERLSCQDTAVALSGQLRSLAVALIKISNDLRWMNSGPNSGLAEIELQALQPGSSIMPGKVNPVIPEAVAQAATQCLGLDTAIAVAGQSGNFQLNVMLPLIGQNLLRMLQLLARSCDALSDKVIPQFRVHRDQLAAAVARNPILVTALNPVIGYQRAAEIAKQAFASGRPILDVAVEMSGLGREELEPLLDPEKLTRGGLSGTD